MKAVADYIHSPRPEGAASTPTPASTAAAARPGQLGHYQQDADQFAAWGYDAVKVDFCGGEQQGLDPGRRVYGQFRDALLNNSSHRPMLFNICNPFTSRPAGRRPPPERSVYDSYKFGPTTGNSWRTDTDIGFVRQRPVTGRAAQPATTTPSTRRRPVPAHWNDPDYLGPELGMTAAEARAAVHDVVRGWPRR